MYVGKAKNLKKRVASYSKLTQLTPRIKQLAQTAQKLKFKILSSELEALLIEAELINLHQPKYNILLKDDKSPIYILITKEKYSRVLKLRKKELNKNKIKGQILGPFQSSYKLNEVLKIARKIFPWCNQPESSKACFYYHLNLCPGACQNLVSSLKYQTQIKNLILFLKGQKKSVIKNIKIQIKTKIKTQDFENANILKNQIDNISEVTDPKYRLKPDLILPRLNQSIALNNLLELKKILKSYLSFPKDYQLKTIEGYDVSNIMGQNAAVSLVTFTDGEADKKKYKLFNIKTLNTPNDYQMLKEAISRRANHREWGTPDLIIVDGGKGQVRSAQLAWPKFKYIIGLAKNPDRLVIPIQYRKIPSDIHVRRRHACALQKDPELFPKLIGNPQIQIKYHVIKLPPDHPALKLAQQVRDEAHRFAKKQHTKLRNKNFIN